MILEVLSHPKCLYLLLPKNLRHLCIWGEELLVLRGLKILFLDVGPEALVHLDPAEHISFGHAHEVSQGWREADGLLQSASFRHCR